MIVIDESLTVIHELEAHEDHVFIVGWISPSILASGSFDNTVKTWSIETGEPLVQITLCADLTFA